MSITPSSSWRPLLVLLLLAFAEPAQADLAKLKSLYAKARNQYFQLELTESEKTLNEAIKLAVDSRLKGPAVARLYLMAGVVKFINAKDKNAATQLMLIGLKLDRKATIDADVVTPELSALHREAVKMLPVVIQPIPFKIFHTASKRAQASQQLPVVVRIQGTAPYRVNLYYRNNELPIFTRVEMLPGKAGQFLLTVPKELLVGKQLLYYFEVVTDAKGVVAAMGTETNPLRVPISGSPDPVDGPRKSRKYKLVNLILGVGFGAGIATGDSDRDPTLKTNAGFALTPLFVWVEVGFMLHQAWELAGYYRFQVLSALAHAGGLKVKWYIDHTLPFRFYLSFGGGGGQIKHTVDFTQPNQAKFVDTTTEGLGHVGLGFGILYNFTPNVGFLAELYNTGHFPRLSFQMDLYVALAINF